MIQIEQLMNIKLELLAMDEIQIGQVDYNLSQLQGDEIPSRGQEGPRTSPRQVLKPFI